MLDQVFWAVIVAGFAQVHVFAMLWLFFFSFHSIFYFSYDCCYYNHHHQHQSPITVVIIIIFISSSIFLSGRPKLKSPCASNSVVSHSRSRFVCRDPFLPISKQEALQRVLEHVFATRASTCNFTFVNLSASTCFSSVSTAILSPWLSWKTTAAPCKIQLSQKSQTKNDAAGAAAGAAPHPLSPCVQLNIWAGVAASYT